MFVINNTQVAEPAQGGVTITDEPIWAPNTGRASDGGMVGDIVCWKTTVSVSWPPLSFAESQTLANAIKNAGPFFQIQYNDFSGSQDVTKTVYTSNLPRTLYSLATAFQRHTGVSVTFIEQ